MSAVARFTFDLDLAHREVEERTVPEATHLEMLESARRAAYAEGRAAGQADAASKAADGVAVSAARLADTVAAFAQNLDAHEKALLRDAVALASVIGKALAARLVAAHPHAELEGLVEECVGSITHAPHLVVRCHPELCEAITETAQERLRVSGFAGRLVVMGDPEIAPGDGRLEWVDGGLVRDLDMLTQEIDARVAAYLAARGAHAPAKETP